MSPYRTRVWIVAACLLTALLLLAGDTAQGKQKKDKEKPKDKQKVVPPDGKSADVMFVLDVTGSMQFAIDGIAEGLESAHKTLKGSGDIDSVRVGLTVFRDRENGAKGKATKNDSEAGIIGDPFTFDFEPKKKEKDKSKGPFTSGPGIFKAAVTKLKAEAGGDIPENSLEALQHAAKAKTRPGRVTRIMVLITDAPPLQTGKELAKAIETTREALVAGHYHHLHLICRKAESGTYEKIWSQEKKGHIVDGKWFAIADSAKAFTGTLDEIAKQAARDQERWRNLDKKGK